MPGVMPFCGTGLQKMFLKADIKAFLLHCVHENAFVNKDDIDVFAVFKKQPLCVFHHRKIREMRVTSLMWRILVEWVMKHSPVTRDGSAPGFPSNHHEIFDMFISGKVLTESLSYCQNCKNYQHKLAVLRDLSAVAGGSVGIGASHDRKGYNSNVSTKIVDHRARWYQAEGRYGENRAESRCFMFIKGRVAENVVIHTKVAGVPGHLPDLKYKHWYNLQAHEVDKALVQTYT